MSLRRKIVLGLFAIFVLVPTSALYLVATTEAGLQFVVRRLGKMGPVTLTPGPVKGTLVDGFTVESLRIQHRQSDVYIQNASGRIELMPFLLLQRLTLPEVRASHVTVTVLQDPTERPKRPLRFLPSMMRIDADAVHVDAADIITTSGRTVPLRKIDGTATILSNQIYVRSGRADLQFLHFVAKGHVRAERPIGLDGDAEVSWALEGQPAWLIAGKFDGNLDKLPLQARVVKPFHASVDGAGTTLSKGWQFAGQAKVQDFDLQPFGGGQVLGIISGELDVSANGNGFGAKGSLTAPGLKAGAMGVDFHGYYRDHGVTIQRATVTHRGSGARATTHGRVVVVKGGPELDLAGEWVRFRWPLASSEPAFSSPRGRYTLSGLKPWNVQLDGAVIAAGQPAMPAQLRGVLATDSLHIDDATVALLGGTARFNGEARWQPAESWHVAGHMNDLNPATLRADLPGKVGFDFTSSGAPFGAAGTLELDAQNVAGKLRGQNLSGKGKLSRAGNSADWQFAGIDLKLGRTRLQLDGSFGVQSDLRFTVDADDLSLFDPEARGRLNASGRYSGTSAAPKLVAKAKGANFEWKGSHLAALDADLDIDLNADGHTDGRVDLVQLKIGDHEIQKASLLLAGGGQQQRVNLNLEASPLRATLQAQGGVREGLWQGTLQNLAVQDNSKLRLGLEAPVAVQANLQQQQVGQICLRGGDDRWCLSGQRQPDGNWTARLGLEAVPLATFTAGLIQNINYDGTINLQADLAGHDADLPTGSFRIDLHKAVLRHRLSNKREEIIPLGSGHVAGSSTNTGFAMQVSLDAETSGNINGELTGERIAGNWQGFPIKGSLTASSDNALSLLDIYVGDIDKANGRLSTRVGIAGTLGAPSLQGVLQLRDAAIDIYQINLALRDLTADASFNNEALEISGKSKLGKGEASFNGKLAWKNREPFGNLHMQGENLRLVDVPEAQIDASPALDFKIDGRRIDVRGEVKVPYAKLEPADLTNVVLASSDEDIGNATAADPAQRWQVTSEIRVALGNQVSINSLGLKAHLGGSITVRTDDSQISRGQGELTIAEGGKFAYLGRLLDIERGKLLFANVPLTDPGIDLRAQKVYPDITAGVNVRGTLRNPKATFFSEPSIPQSQIASLILAGGSLESAQNSQRNGAGRNALLAQGVAIAAQPLSSRVGVDDVGIETDLTNDTSLVLGKYLSPRIYVSWGFGLAEAINTFKLRYTIGDRWTIKTEAGKERSADIVYTIQK